ncbi:tudor domain-containing protein 15-like [Haliotis asinina]|uniref:tudor domain-containing protein 15-like n=1 Tax=Haliotis asinina TaxID=109174 RepID=UPI003531CD93
MMAYGQRETIFMGGGAEFEAWDPLRMDYEDQQFNSYNKGPGNRLANRQRSTKNGVTLYVQNLPLGIDEQGLMNMFSNVGKVSKTHVNISTRDNSQCMYGYVEMASVREAEEGIRKMDGFVINKHCLKVQVALSQEEREARMRKRKEDEEFLSQLNSGRRSNFGSDSDEHNNRARSFQGNKPRTGRGRAELLDELTDTESGGRRPGQDKRNNGLLGSSPFEGPQGVVAPGSYPYQSRGGRGQHGRGGYHGNPGHMPLHDYPGGHGLNPPLMGQGYGYGNINNNFAPPGRGRGFMNMNSFHGYSGRGRYLDGGNMYNGPGIGRGYGRFPYQDHIQGGGHFQDPARMFPAGRGMPYRPQAQAFPPQDMNPNYYGPGRGRGNSFPGPSRPGYFTDTQRKGKENSAPKPDSRPCLFCKKMGTLQCMRCKMPYCSRKCQQRDWEKGHKSLCLQISEMRNCSEEELDSRFDVSVTEDFFENGSTTGRKPASRDMSDSSSEGSKKMGRGSRGRGGKTTTATKTKQSKKMTENSPPKDKKPVNGTTGGGSSQTKGPQQTVGGKHGAPASLPSKKTISNPQAVTRFFFKNITQTQLPVGSSVQVAVTHVENPTEIWIQKGIFEDLEKLEQLKEKMNKVCGSSSSKVTAPMVGDVLAAQFQQQWYRAVVRSLKAPDNATVFYFDYGNSATVTYSQLGNVTEEMCKLPAQAVCCCLEGVRPVKERWSQEAVAMLRSELEQRVCVFQADDQKDGRYTGQMFLPDGGSSVKDMLIEKGLARSKGPLMVARDMTTLSQSLHVGREMTILILEWKSPVCFSAQLMEADNVNSFHSLIQDIKMVCLQEGPHTSPRVGEFVIGQWTDGAWYRAEVLEVDKTKVKVLYVDFGNVEDIDIQCVRAGREAFAQLPIQCLICQLHGVTTPESGVWPKEVNELFKSLAGTDGVRTEVPAVVKSKQNTRLAVELYDVNDKPISVAITAKLKECLQTVPSVPKIDMLPLDGTSVQVAITEVVSCDCFYVQHVQIVDEDAAMKMLEALARCGESPAYTTPAQGEMVAAKFSLDNDWYRSVVTSVTSSHCEVMFVDYGNREVVPVASIRKLDHSAMLLPQRAMRCSLAGLHNCTATQKDMLNQHVNTAVNVVALSETEGVYDVKVTLTDGQCLNDVLSAAVTSSAVYTLEDVAMTTPPAGKSPVIVMFVEDPGSLYCRLADKEAEEAFTILSRNMGLFYKGQTTPAADPQLNQLFCVEAEGSWYRCVMVERRGVAVRVRLLDVGTMEELAVTDLRAMKTEFLELPVPVFKCSLHGIKPTGSTWVQDAIDAVKRIEGQTLLMTLKGKTDEIFEVQLSDTDNEAVQVSAILVGQGLAVSAERPVQAASDPPIIAANLQKASLPLDGTEVEAIASHIQDFDELFIQVMQCAIDLGDLMLQLNVVCQSSDATLFPGKGEMVAALFEGNWYRARVDGVKETNCRVFFVDYGNYDNVPFSSIKKLDPEFCQIPMQGIHCSLAGVNIKNDKEKLKQLHEVVLQKKLVVKAISVSGSIFSVQIQTGQHNVNELFKLKPDIATQEDILNQNSLNDVKETSAKILQYDSVPVPALPCASLPTDGSAVEAVATDVQNFSSIYIQTIEGFLAMQEFTVALITRCMNDETTITPIVGDYVCACFSEDSVWYRALVTEVTDSTCNVFFVDYGNSDTLPFSQIKRLDASLRSPPIQGVKCRLDGVDGGSPEMLEKLKQTIRDQHLKVRAVGRQDDVYSVVIEVNGTCVNDMFTTDVNSQQPMKFVSLATDGTDMKAVAVFVQSFDVIYIQTQDGHGVLSDLMDEMNAQCAKNPFTIKPLVGDYVCAFFSSVDEWYRARVDEVIDSQCKVFSLDFGFSETVPYSSIKRLDKQFRHFPIQGIHCSLDGVPMKDDPEKLTELQEKITNKHLNVKVVNKRDGAYHVEIRVDGELLNDYFHTNNGTASLETKPSLTTPSNILQSPASQVLPSKTITPKTPSSGMSSPSPSPALRMMTYAQLPLGNTVDALATDVHDFDCITIQMIKGCADLISVTEEMKVYCTNTHDSVVHAVGDTVCALYSGDQEWYRARIDEVRDNVCHVFFLDYGNSEMVKITDLRKMPDDFLTVPIQGIQCSLQAVSIRNNQEKIKELKKRIFNEKLSVKALSRYGNVYNVEMLVEETSINDMFATVLSEDQDLATIELPQGTYDAIVMDIQDFDCIYFQTFEGYLEIIELMKEINLSCTNCPDSITPQVGDAVCALFLQDNTWYRARVEEETKDGKYRVFFFDHGNSDVVLPAQIKMLEKRFRSLPVKGYRCHLNNVTVRNDPVKLALLQEKISGVKLQVTVLDKVDEVYSVEIQVEGESINDLFNTPVVQVMTCSEIPINGLSVEACVTHVEDFDAVSIQTVEGALALEPLMKEMNTRCSSNPNTIIPKVGDMVCAFYSQYQSWYRARVDEVTDTDCLVYFFDYGNSDRVELQLVRELESKFAVVPQQAVKCSLEGVDVRDNREELVKLAETVDNQKVIITASSLKDGVYQVKMCLGDGATSVNSMFQPQCPDDDDDDEEEAIRKQIEELQLRLASKTKKKT